MQQIARADFQTPEHINDSTATAPSKRIIGICPAYNKTVFGVLAARKIGMNKLRLECRHFDQWVSALERLA